MEYENREKRFNDELPSVVGNFMKSVSLADGEARMQSIGILQEILRMENVTLEQKISILNHPDPLVYAASIPAVTVGEGRPFLASRATLSMSMNVHASTVEETAIDSESSGEGRVSFGWGLFKGSIGMKASVSTHSSKKRESDYSATTDMTLEMERHPLPEGLAIILDGANAIAKSAAEMNIMLAQAEATRIVNEGAQLPTPSEEEKDAEQQNDSGSRRGRQNADDGMAP